MMTKDELLFPPEDVKACQEDEQLQRESDRQEAQERYVGRARACPSCTTPPLRLSCIYFTSPGWKWEMLCGREGWLTHCRWCDIQVDFFLEVMN